MEKVVEICCGSYEDAMNAYRGGASRIELNSALHLGGLTPSLATLSLTKKDTDLKVIAMVRPRGAGFHYTDDEFRVMKHDAVMLLEHGADGIAFGCLDESGHVNRKRTGQMVAIIKDFQGEAVFHRAFDCVEDPIDAIETLIELGVDRVLTSGLEAKAFDGMAILKKLQDDYGDRIEILAGSGINASNAKELMKKTGISQVHSSCKDWVKDPTTALHNVSFAYADEPHVMDYDVVSVDLVRKIIESL